MRLCVPCVSKSMDAIEKFPLRKAWYKMGMQFVFLIVGLIFGGLQVSANAATTDKAGDLKMESSVKAYALRFSPGDDPKVLLQKFVVDHKINAASIASAVGSFKVTTIRYANEKEAVRLEGFREVVSLSGTLGATSGAHLHVSVSDSKGNTLGGHWTDGSQVYTTLEVVLLAYPDFEFQRVLDPKSTFNELKVVLKK